MQKRYKVIGGVLVFIVVAWLWSWGAIGLMFDIAHALTGERWPPSVGRTETSQACGPMCPPGTVITRWERSCLGLKVRGSFVTDAPQGRYCIGMTMGDWKKSERF